MCCKIQSLEWIRSHHEGRHRRIERGSSRKETASCVYDSLYHEAHTTVAIKIKVSSNTNEHLFVLLWLVKQYLCEAILEQMSGSTCLGRGGAFSNFERTVSQRQNTWMSVGVNSLMEIFLQNPGTLSVRIDVGQICCAPDDVFMIILIKPWRKKRSTHLNWSKQLQRDHESGILETNSFTDMLFSDE